MPRAISRTVADHACPCHVPRARTLLPALAGLDTSSPARRGVVTLLRLKRQLSHSVADWIFSFFQFVSTSCKVSPARSERSRQC